MVTLQAFAILRDFKLVMDEDLFQVGNFTFVKPEPDYNKVFDEAFDKRFGTVIKKNFLNRTYVYAKLTVNDLDDEAEAGDIIVNHFTTELGSLINGLWYLGDTSAALQNILVLGNDAILVNLNAGNTKADASNEESSYSKEDIDYSLDFRTKMRPYLTLKVNNTERFKTPPDKIIISKPVFHYAKQNEINRLERCFNFLSNARENPYLPLKIALYMSAFETLFATPEDKAEINHKISTRTAQYLSGDLAERKAITKKIKDAYNIRSTFFHGQAQSSKLADIAKIGVHSVIVDELLRKVLKKVILQDGERFNDEGKHKELLEELTFPEYKKMYALKAAIEKHYADITPTPLVSYNGAKQTLYVTIGEKQMNFTGLEASGRWESAVDMKDHYDVTTDEAMVWILKGYQQNETA